MNLSPVARVLGGLFFIGCVCGISSSSSAVELTGSVSHVQQMIPSESQKQLTGYTDGALVLTSANTVTPIDARSKVVYAQVNNLKGNNYMQLHMHLLMPRTNEPKPAIIFFPGGGFTSSDYDRYLDMRYALAHAGFVVASAEYRVVPFKFPCLVEDGKAAVRYLRAHAQELGIDSERIGVLGDSAGGYMSQMIGTTNGEKEFDRGDFLNVSSDVQAAVSIYGISNLLNIGEGFADEIVAVHKSPAVTEALLLNGPAFDKFAGAPVDVDLEKAKYASPINHVDKDDPPMLLMHGSADPLVSPMQSVQMYQAQKKAGVDTTYILVEGADHGGIMWYQEPVIKQVVSFFEEKLGKTASR